MDSDKLNPEIIRKTYPRPIQAFIKAVERKDGELWGTVGLIMKGYVLLALQGSKPYIIIIIIIIINLGFMQQCFY
jgi:hypothetical protein